MEEALSCIGRMPIFNGIEEEELYTLIKCCVGQMAMFENDRWIFQAGEELGSIMVVFSKKRRSILCRERYLVKIMPVQVIKHCL